MSRITISKTGITNSTLELHRGMPLCKKSHMHDPRVLPYEFDSFGLKKSAFSEPYRPKTPIFRVFRFFRVGLLDQISIQMHAMEAKGMHIGVSISQFLPNGIRWFFTDA